MEDSNNPQNSSIRRAQDDAEPAEASKFLEDLQKASQEIEADIQKKKPVSRPQPNYNPPKGWVVEKDYNPPATLPPEGRAPKTGLEEVKVENEILARDWLKEITNERQKLEQAYKEAENLRRKIQQKLDRMKNLEINFSKVKNELTHFQQIKKENQTFLEEIKNMLKNQNEH